MCGFIEAFGQTGFQVSRQLGKNVSNYTEPLHYTAIRLDDLITARNVLTYITDSHGKQWSVVNMLLRLG